MAITANMETKLSALKDAVKVLNDATAANENTKAKEEAVKAAVREINALVVSERIDALRAMPADEMWPEYIDHQFCDAYGTVKDNETGRYSVVLPTDEKAPTVRVTFHALDTAGDRLSRMGNWGEMLTIMCENFALFKSAEVGKEYCARNAMNAKLMEKRKAMGPAWQPRAGKLSKNQLEAMLNEVVFAIIPDDVCGKMVKADVEFIATALVNADQRRGDVAGSFSTRNSVSMEAFLFTAIYTRRNGLAYKFQTGKKESVNTQDPTKADYVPEEYADTPKAGPVTVVVSEPEAPAEESAAE